MNAIVATAGALVLAVALAGCGDESSKPQAQPDVAGAPTWTCRVHAQQMIDYVSDAPGAESPAAALSPYRKDGDHVVVVPRHDHMRRQWLLVDDSNVIHTALDLSRLENGWLVSGVEKCAR